MHNFKIILFSKIILLLSETKEKLIEDIDKKRISTPTKAVLDEIPSAKANVSAGVLSSKTQVSLTFC